MLAFFSLGLPELIVMAIVFALIIGAPLAIILLVVFLVRRGQQQPGAASQPQAPPDDSGDPH